ncbi:MAG: hypothetical protein KAR47_01480 [Planctomycetes bacterium]|nr:hypothetical protein [Planctomycetota bacterium]
MDNKPQLIIRMGSHAEKEYILKLSKQFDGIIVGANIVEATAGATASLLGQKLKIPYYIDPMTYVFGCDLEGIMSERKIKGKKKPVKDYKRAYKRLAPELGDIFSNTLEKHRPISPENFTATALKQVCQKVIDYQLKRLHREFEKDDEYKEYADSIPRPAGVFSPYFFINSDDWFRLFLNLSKTSAAIKPGPPVYSVLCADYKMLIDKSFIDRAVAGIPKTGVKGVWLWFSNFDEWVVQEKYLGAFKSLVEQLSENGLEVYNRHGGYFSLALNKVGMSGISHGVGYGEKKDVLQIKGPPNAPVVRYYLPDIYRRLGMLEIERCFNDLNITTPTDFYEKICDCVICKGVVKNSILDFQRFGEMHYATSESKRQSQTSAAAKRCRFHFLVNRIIEKDFIGGNDLAAIIQKISDAEEKWKEQLPIINNSRHIARWKAVLSS